MDGKSFGIHDSIVVSVPPGKHSIEGRKLHCFSDWEKVTTLEDSVEHISVKPRRLHFSMSAQVIPVVPIENESLVMVTLQPGLRFWPMYLGLDISPTIYGFSKLFLAGLHVDYLYDYRNLFEFAAGGFFTYYQIDKDQDNTDLNVPPEPAVHIKGGSVCPELRFLFGREHAFFIICLSGIIGNGFCPLASLGFVISP